LRFHGNNGYAKEPQCYVIHALSVLFCVTCPALVKALRQTNSRPGSPTECLRVQTDSKTHKVEGLGAHGPVHSSEKNKIK